MSLIRTDFATAILSPSPNYWPGRYGYEPKVIVMHGTAGSCPGALTWLCDPTSAGSVHYIVWQSGRVDQLVSEQDSAWGNGIVEPGSVYVGQANPNWWSISIEHERTGDNTSPISAAQQAASAALVASIRARWGPLPLIPHSAIAPQSRAHCPGPGFPLQAIDQGTGQPSAPSGVVRLATPFTARPQHVPLVFYRDWSFARPAYTSGATAHTAMQFDQWTHGPAVTDGQTGQPDRRWYHRYNPAGMCGWTPSAWLVGDAPGSAS